MAWPRTEKQRIADICAAGEELDAAFEEHKEWRSGHRPSHKGASIEERIYQAKQKLKRACLPCVEPLLTDDCLLATHGSLSAAATPADRLRDIGTTTLKALLRAITSPRYETAYGVIDHIEKIIENERLIIERKHTL